MLKVFQSSLSPYFLTFALLVAAQGGFAQKIHINQVGYSTFGPKTAVLEYSGSFSNFQLKQVGSDQVVYNGAPGAAQNVSDWNSNQYFRLDFSDFQTPGTYYLAVSGVTQSQVFEIAEHILFNITWPRALDFFQANRADQSDYAIWNKDAAVRFYGDYARGTRNVQGGWYDASGDVSKYLSHLNYANFMSPQQIPMVTWGFADMVDRYGGKLGAYFNEAQDEALWGAEYLMKVLDAEGYFYITVFDGWTHSTNAREICAFSGSDGTKSSAWQAGFREGAGMSIASLARISTWASSTTSTQYLTAAETAWQHLVANDYANAKAYADNGILNIIDDYTILMAATELYLATNTQQYLTVARERAQALNNRLHAEGYFIADNGSRPYWHAAEAGLPLIALARYMEAETDATHLNLARQTIQTNLDYQISVTANTSNPFGYARQHFRSQNTVQSGFFIPHDNETGYWWQGESARLGSLAAAAIIAGQKLNPTSPGPLGVSAVYHDYAFNQLNWIMGLNPYDINFQDGTGRNNPPDYNGHPHVYGGISNGITGSQTNGSGIIWNRDDGTTWGNWRWVEQWIPHGIWYMVAVAATSQETDSGTPVLSAIPNRQARSFALAVRNDYLHVEFKAHTTTNQNWTIQNLKGEVIQKGQAEAGIQSLTLDSKALPKGVLVFKLGKQPGSGFMLQ
jgi:hypothetical protein